MLDKILDVIAHGFLFTAFGIGIGWVFVVFTLIASVAPKFVIGLLGVSLFISVYFWAIMRCSERGLIKFKPAKNGGPK